MMPGILEDMAEQIRQLHETISQIADIARAGALPDCPLTPDESAWADGALSVKDACEFLTIGQTKLADLIATGQLVSAMDGRRLVAKRGCIRYLLAHQEHTEATGTHSHDVRPLLEKTVPRKGANK